MNTNIIWKSWWIKLSEIVKPVISSSGRAKFSNYPVAALTVSNPRNLKNQENDHLRPYIYGHIMYFGFHFILLLAA